MSKQKILNKFNRSHAGLRKFLRLVSYGCYHRKLFTRHAITPRSYDDMLRQIRFFVPEKNLQVTRHDKCSYFTFVGDFRHGTRNYFYRSFLLKTLLPEHCLQKIILLKVLADEEFLSTPEILERAEQLITEHKPELLDADLVQSLRRRLNELTDSGVVSRLNTAGKSLYKKISNPLSEFSADELKILYDALKFLRNVAPVGTAGYFLCDSLESFCGDIEEREIFQFRNNNFARILDDDILLTINEALNRRKKILVEREGKPPVTVTPVAVETDFLCSRQYLVALSRNELMRLRVERITNIHLTNDDATEKFSPPRQKLREVRLRVKFADIAERRLREKLLADELPIRLVEETDGEFTCVVETLDPLQIYPRLWKFQPWAEILPGADGLRERMRSDVQEALKNYAEPI